MSQISGLKLLLQLSNNDSNGQDDFDNTDNVHRATENFIKFIEDKINFENKSLKKAQKEIKEAKETDGE